MEQYRIERLKRHMQEGTLIRGMWNKTDDDGREFACLLFALAPEVGPYGNISVCPGSVMPQWLAYLTPWIDDAPSDEAWEELVARYAELASRWHVLDAEDWRRLDYAVRGIVLREAMQHTQEEKTLQVCKHVLDLCDREAQGEPIDTKTWSAANTRAKAVAASAWKAKEAVSTVKAAEVAAFASKAETEAAWAAFSWVQVSGNVDRLVAAILDKIEQVVSG